MESYQEKIRKTTVAKELKYQARIVINPMETTIP